MATLKEMIAADIAKRKGQKKPGLMDALRNSARVMDDGFFGGAFQRIPAETNRLMQRAKAAPAELNALVGPQMRQKVNTAMAKPAPANPQQWIDKGMELSGMAPFMGMVGQTVYHGSPHKFDKFDMSKIGTGEGAQAYGHGLYFAENPNIAKFYADALAKHSVRTDNFTKGMFGNAYRATTRGSSKLFDVSSNDEIPQGAVKALREIMQIQVNGQIYDNALPSHEKVMHIFNKQYPVLAKKIAGKKINLGVYDLDGNLVQLPDPQKYFYKVDIPDEAIPRMLDWDKPLSEQSPEVQAALANTKNKQLRAMVDYASSPYSTPELAGEVKTIGEAIKLLGMNASPAKGSALLAKHGIPGIRYLDGNSRGTGGTSNYVLFDDQLPRILEVNGVPTGLEPWPKNKLWPK